MSDAPAPAIETHAPGAGAPPVTPVVPAAGTPPPAPVEPDYNAWKLSLPEELRNSPAIANVKATTEREALSIITKQHINAQKLIGGDRVLKPKPDWTPEQLRQWREDLGTPKTTDAYKPDLTPYQKVVDKDAFSQLQKIAHEAGLTVDQFDTLTKGWYKYGLERTTNDETKLNQTFTAMQESLKKTWGNDYEKNMDLVNFGLSKAPEATQKLFKDEPGLLRHPGSLELLMNYGKMNSNDNASGAFRSTTLPTPGLNPMHPVEITSKIAELEADPTWALVIARGGLQTVKMDCMQSKTPFAPIEAKYNAILKQRTELYKLQTEARAMAQNK